MSLRSGMALFSRRRAVASPGAGSSPPQGTGTGAPLGYDAVAEALLDSTGVAGPCAVVGRELARDGASLGEALSGLVATYAAVGAGPPDFLAAEALSVAWSEATLEFLQDVTCEDPLTGLASAPHLRTRLAEVYRAADHDGSDVRRTHALVVVDVAGEPGATAGLRTTAFDRALGLATVAEVVRAVFAADQTVARIGPNRVAALVRRTDDLGRSVTAVRLTLDRAELPGSAAAWIEGLPGTLRLGVRLLGDLTR